MKIRALLPLLLTSACGGLLSASHEADLDTPVDMLRGTSSILIHRPQAIGTSSLVQGVMRKHRRLTAMANGYVVYQQKQDLQLAYDLAKTVAELDLEGNPKRVRYDVSFLQATDAELPPFAAMAEGRVVKLTLPGEAQVVTSSGQSFDLTRQDGRAQVSMRSGTLTSAAQEALTDPMGPGYELGFERQLARMFSPKTPQREGEEWDIDLKLAQELLVDVGQMAPPMRVTGKATLVGREKVGSIPVLRIEAWIKGDGGLRHEITTKMHANINRVELKYVGVFPVDLSLPPVEHSWRVKGKGHMVVEIEDTLGDVHFEVDFEHQSRTLEVHR